MKPLTLKDVFGGEATGFTPWLEAHCEVLADICEESVSVFKREAKIHNYYMDLTLQTRTGKLYVVENQYGEADHDHLGKCILYAVLSHAKQILWISEQFHPEHEQILRELDIPLVLVQCNVFKEEEKTILLIQWQSKEKSNQLKYHLTGDLSVQRVY